MLKFLQENLSVGCFVEVERPLDWEFEEDW